MTEFLIIGEILEKYVGSGAHAVIPAGVTAIREAAFAGADVERVTLSDTVCEVGGGAFRGCRRLHTVDLGNAPVTVRTEAFAECDALREIRLSPRLVEIFDRTLQRHKGLERIVAPTELSSRPDWWWFELFGREAAFRTALECFTDTACPLFRAMRSSREEAFGVLLKYGLASAVERFLSLWERVPYETLEEYLSRAAREERTAVEISLMDYRARVWSTEEIAEILRIREEKALGLIPLTEEDLRRQFQFMQAVPYQSWYPHLSPPTEEERMRMISIYEYRGRDSVVWIPKKIGELTVIGVDANFVGTNSSAVALVVDSDHEYLSTREGNLYSTDGSVLVRYAPGSPASHFTVPSGVRRIGDAAFSFSPHLESVHIPKECTCIGTYAFEGGERLTRLVWEGDYEELSHRAFWNAPMLREVELEGLSSVFEDLFRRCKSLRTVTLGRALSYLDAAAFGANAASITVRYRGSESEWTAVEKDGGEPYLLEFLEA